MDKFLSVMRRLGPAVLGIILWCSAAGAGLIINTGQPTGPDAELQFLNIQYFSGLGGRIYLDKAYDLDRLEGWIRRDLTDAGISCLARLYHDGSATSNDYAPGALIAQYAVSVNPAFVENWYGASFSPLRLAGGWYWLSFEVDNSTQYFGGSFRGRSPQPLGLEAKTWQGIDGPWYRQDDLDLGYRVYGTPVPLPGAVWLLGAGLLGLAGGGRLLRKP